MLNIFKDTRYGYFLLSFLSIIFFVVYVLFRDGNYMFALLGLLIWILASAVLLTKTAAKRLNKINHLKETCRIKDFIDSYEKLANGCKNRSLLISLNLNLSSGYLMHGDYERALKLLQSIIPSFSSQTESGIVSLISYYNNLYMAYANTNDLERGEKALECMKAVLQNPKLRQDSRNKLLHFYESKSIHLDMCRGNYEGAEKYFLRSLETEMTQLGKVSNSYQLAKIYLHSQEAEQAEQYLRYTAANGGDTYYAVWAKEKLKELNLC